MAESRWALADLEEELFCYADKEVRIVGVSLDQAAGQIVFEIEGPGAPEVEAADARLRAA